MTYNIKYYYTKSKNPHISITDDSMDSKSCAYKLNDIFISRFKPVLGIINANDFLTSKTESELFELYNKMLDLDVHHYMTGTTGDFVISEIHL